MKKPPVKWIILLAEVAVILAAILVIVRIYASTPAEGVSHLDRLHLQPGFHMEIYAEVPGAREICVGPKGTVFVGTKSMKGKVFAVLDHKVNGKRQVITIADQLSMPNGVAMHNNDLYVAEVSRILRFADIENHLDAPPKPEVVYDRFAGDTHHGWKHIRFGPDGMLYVPIGSPCNVCARKEYKTTTGELIPYGSMMRLEPDGSGLQVVARGIRNTVGFDWDPRTKDLWFTDNGRDWLGDDLPPDELDHAPKIGMDFGFPYRYGNNVLDPEFGTKSPPDAVFTPPAECLGPHVASLGMKFYTGDMFPPQYKGQIFIAEHGSWNRSTKIGYRVSLVRLDKSGKAIEYTPFVDGWLTKEGNVWGRPVDLLQLPDGSLLISDDAAGFIYRLTYNNDDRGSTPGIRLHS